MVASTWDQLQYTEVVKLSVTKWSLARVDIAVLYTSIHTLYAFRMYACRVSCLVSLWA